MDGSPPTSTPSTTPTPNSISPLNGDNASGVSYCLVTLIGMENGKRMKTSILVIYNDTYVRQGGTWLIADRKSNFATREQEELR